MEAGPVRFSLEDGQALLTEARNALSVEVMAGLAAEGLVASLAKRPPGWKDR